MAKYRGKPVVIKAVKFEDTAHSIADISNLVGQRTIVIGYQIGCPTVTIPTLHGNNIAQVGDYIVREGDKLYLYKQDTFEKTYKREHL
ncbi:hypothetical protein [Bacillus velezensis]|uniref:hypothetical protein n=1 Tax=Bacillus velezensis TaxID=492670 RepID=UPI0033949FDC